MATLETPSVQSANPSSPVPLDTIPVSPSDGKPSDGDTTPNGTTAKREYKETDQITVFHDPDNFNVKHPLIHKWTLWFTKPPSGKVMRSLRWQMKLVADLARETIGTIYSERL